MSSFEGGLFRGSGRAIGFFAALALVFLAVAWVAARGSDEASDPVVNSDGSPCFDWTLDSTDSLSDLSDPNGEYISVDDVVKAYDECLQAGDSVFIVQGLPQVSGIYRSTAGNMALESFSFAEGAQNQPIGRCFVDKEHIFKSKAVVAQGTALTTIDVGVTGQGGPYAAVVRESIVTTGEDSSATASLVTHNYNPGQPNTVTASFPAWDADSWTGVAMFLPTEEAHTYNERDYSPWTESDDRNAPNYPFVIYLMCK